ncbi:MAG TPA: signal peptidase II [Xanthobacteraceae bacterium]|nr:signal peptidase II [Xanthobacteraceae bacterium]
MSASRSSAPLLYGPATALGLVVAALAVLADQASKLWLLFVFDLPARSPVTLGPFIDLVMAWNTGISYGLFPQDGRLGAWLLFAIKAGAVVFLWMWLARAGSKLTAVALGLIIGGAVGNAIDRAVHGAVVDFVLFHITTQTFRFNWYVFNLADVAIVAGVAGVLYDSLVTRDAAKAP